MQAGATPGFDDALVRSLTAGTGADKALYVWHNYFTLGGSGGTQTINLASLTDKWNGTFAFTLVKWLLAVVLNGGVLTLSAAASNGWGATTTAPYGTDKLIVHDLCLLTSPSLGWGVSSSSKNLKLTNTGSGGIAFLLLLAGQ